VVPGIPSTTAGSLARRFGPAMCPVAREGDRGSGLHRCRGLREPEAAVAYDQAGQRAGRSHLATWAEAGLTVAAELLAGNDDVRPRAAAMLRRAGRDPRAGAGRGGCPRPAAGPRRCRLLHRRPRRDPPALRSPRSRTPRPGGQTTATRSCVGSGSRPRRSRPTPAPAGAAPTSRIREAKLGAALRHLPSGHQAVNTGWM